MSQAPVLFEKVTKTFARGEYHDSLRDLLMRVVRPGRRPKREWFNALDAVDLEVQEGEALGIIGPNGSGKSTALKLLTGIYVPTSGRVHVGGRVAPLIEVGAGFHPDLTGRENVYLNGAISGMSRAEVERHFDEIVDFSGISKFLDTPVKRYSSGMYMRLGFSIAAHIPSDILVVDEVLAVGDVGFRVRCIERMKLLKQEGRTILFVSHNPYQVRSLCDRVVYLVDGKIEFDGETHEGTQRYEQDLLAGRVGKGSTTGKEKGDAPAALSEARILSGASDEGVVLAPGDDLAVAVRYRLDADMPAPPVLSVGLMRHDGVMSCVLNTREAEFPLAAGSGEHDVTARFEQIPLNRGKYSVEVLLWDEAMLTVIDQMSAGSVEFRREGVKQTNRPGVFVPEGGFRNGGA